MQHFTDTAALAGTRITADGYMVGEVLCARTGCQDYLASDLGLGTGGTVSVYRAPDVVFDKASLATFAGKPVTMGHPVDAVTADNWKALSIGDIGTEVARDGEFVRVPYKIMDAAAIAEIRRGTREVSMGYTTGLEMRDGVAPDGTPYQAVQTGPIRINHLAIVPKARGGSSLRIGDADYWGASPLPHADMKGSQMTDTLRKIMVDGLQVEVTDAAAVAIEKLQTTIKDMKASMTAAELKAKEAEEDADKKLASKDAEIATKDAAIADAKAKVLDATAIDTLVKDRADLIARAKAVQADVVTDGKSAAEIKKAVVTAKRGAAMADKSEAYIDAAFDLLNDATDPIKGAQIKDAPTDLSKVYSARNAALADAWKTPAAKEA